MALVRTRQNCSCECKESFYCLKLATIATPSSSAVIALKIYHSRRLVLNMASFGRTTGRPTTRAERRRRSIELY